MVFASRGSCRVVVQYFSNAQFFFLDNPVDRHTELDTQDGDTVFWETLYSQEYS